MPSDVRGHYYTKEQQREIAVADQLELDPRCPTCGPAAGPFERLQAPADRADPSKARLKLVCRICGGFVSYVPD